MDAHAMLEYGHADLLRALDGLPPELWTKSGVTSRWSVKDLVAHLVSYEILLEEALMSVYGPGPWPTLEAMGRKTFNAEQVEARASRTPGELLKELNDTHARVMALVDAMPPERLRETGTIPWYGEAYALDDFIVYTNYAHKREHCAQIRRFRMQA
jgi:hypothetical protein